MKTTEKIEMLVSQLKANDDFAYEVYKGVFLYTYTSKKGNYCFAKFRDKSAKLSDHVGFTTEEGRANYIAKVKKAIDRDIDEANERLEQGRKLNEQYVVGAILVSSWGYEQTNIDFYQVVARTNDTVTLIEIGQYVNTSETYGDRGTCTPNPDYVKSDPFKKRIGKNGWISLNSYKSATIHDGTPRYFSSYA